MQNTWNSFNNIYRKKFYELEQGNTDIETALKNVAIDSVGKFAGAGVGAN